MNYTHNTNKVYKWMFISNENKQMNIKVEKDEKNTTSYRLWERLSNKISRQDCSVRPFELILFPYRALFNFIFISLFVRPWCRFFLLLLHRCCLSIVGLICCILCMSVYAFRFTKRFRRRESFTYIDERWSVFIPSHSHSIVSRPF